MSSEHAYKQQIKQRLNYILTKTDLPYDNKMVGKVRDSYILKNALLLVTTDRQSAFDRILAEIPFKGSVLNLTSAWWFQKTAHIIPNHVLHVPDPNAMIVKKCKVFPIEFVMRGYITGTTQTSLWTLYNKGMRNVCGVDLEEGLRKNQKLNYPIITPTTKDKHHDRPISPKEIIEEQFMTKNEWEYCAAKAKELFIFGQQEAAKKGLILVDTKYEMGRNDNGEILLIDEIHTPDSSRYWYADSYQERFNANKEPQNFDKEFLRLWFAKNCNPYEDKVLPDAPEDLIIELSYRYICIYEQLTGLKFNFPSLGEDRYVKLKNNLIKYI